MLYGLLLVVLVELEVRVRKAAGDADDDGSTTSKANNGKMASLLMAMGFISMEEPRCRPMAMTRYLLYREGVNEVAEWRGLRKDLHREKKSLC